jgi:S-adenosylmethionine:tRNA ribosyltransferase-isomerase
MTVVDFVLPAGLEASAPPDHRDDVRLLVSAPTGVRHARFADLGAHLSPGDLVVVNTSGTLPAAVDGSRGGGRSVSVHFATRLDDPAWVVEIRPRFEAAGPVHDLVPGERIELPQGVTATIAEPHPPGQRRLWRADVPVEEA